jgi:hypothetical protein
MQNPIFWLTLYGQTVSFTQGQEILVNLIRRRCFIVATGRRCGFLSTAKFAEMGHLSRGL